MLIIGSYIFGRGRGFYFGIRVRYSWKEFIVFLFCFYGFSNWLRGVVVVIGFLDFTFKIKDLIFI